MRDKLKVLFILKLRHDYYGAGDDEGEYSYTGVLSSGLYVSAVLVEEMLRNAGIETKLVQVVDMNSIDREVTKYQPTHVFIEAFWVVPSKFTVLQQLHPTVKWIVRVHSETPFLAQEGIAFDWAFQYIQFQNVQVAFNSKTMAHDFRRLAHFANPNWSGDEVKHKVINLPNYFPVTDNPNRPDSGNPINIGCFGALRGLKNQLSQAVAAVNYAEEHNLNLNFHISFAFHGGWDGESVLKNMRALFKNVGQNLIEHTWQTHEDFIKILAGMDIGMQVSFTESFNLIAADMINLRIPVVVSPAISWASRFIQADPNSVKDIVSKMNHATGPLGGFVKRMNLNALSAYAEDARETWLGFLGHGG